MELKRHGYKVLPRTPSSFTPLEDGRYLLLGPDEEMTRREIAKFSQHDADAYPRYNRLLGRIAECLEPVLNQTPPDLLPLPREWREISFGKKLRDTKTGWSIFQALKQLGSDMPEAIELLTGAARPILERWFESDILKATLATDAIIGTFLPIDLVRNPRRFRRRYRALASRMFFVSRHAITGRVNNCDALRPSFAQYSVQPWCKLITAARWPWTSPGASGLSAAGPKSSTHHASPASNGSTR